MKKILVLLLATTLCMSIVACSSGETPSSAVSSESSLTEISSTDNGNASSDAVISEPIDTSLYRGVVTEIETIDETSTILTLAQYEGTDFGAGEIQILVTPSTTLSSDFSVEQTVSIADFAQGDYVQVYFSGPMEAAIDESADAIMMINLGDPTSVITNGVVESVSEPEEGNTEGTITIASLDNNQTIIVRYDTTGTTQLYLNVSELAQGDQISILHSPMMAASEPPQIVATEIRTFVEDTATTPTSSEESSQDTTESSTVSVNEETESSTSEG